MRFTIFRWSDFLTFGVAAFLVSGLAVGAAFTPQERSLWGLWLVVGIFWAAYLRLVVWRWQSWRRVTFTTVHGTHVMAEGFPVDQNEFEMYVDDLLRRYIDALGRQHVADVYGAARNLLVIFKPWPFETHKKPQKLAGLVKLHSKIILVGFEEPLAETALGHELGHLILNKTLGDPSERHLRTFTKAHRLPY